MGGGQRKHEKEYRVQAVKLAKEIGAGKAAAEHIAYRGEVRDFFQQVVP